MYLILLLKFITIVCTLPINEEQEGTDQGLYNNGLFEGDIFLNPTEEKLSRNAIADKSKLWPYGAIPYTVDKTLGCPNSQKCKQLNDAMETIHNLSCVRFKQWTGEKYRIHIFINSEDGACWSPVGRSGIEIQNLSLGKRCWYKGIILHELLHSIGFWHEMTRPDRDTYIDIYWENIMSGFSYAFHKQENKEVITLGENFDYKSLMMYDEYAFSKDGVSLTLRAKTPSLTIGPIWKKNTLSDSDKRRLLSLYSCKGNTPKSGFPYDINCDFNTNSCGFQNSGISSWSWRQILNSEGHLYTFKGARDKGLMVSSTFHPSHINSDKLGCVSFLYHIGTTAKLKLMHAYVSKSSDVNFNPDTTYELWSNSTLNNDQKISSLSSTWLHVQIPIYVTSPFKLIFESEFMTKAKNTDGGIAIDNLKVSYNPCKSSKSIETTVNSYDYKINEFVDIPLEKLL